MHRIILSLTPFHVNFKQGKGFNINQNKIGTMINMIGRIPVNKALKYSVVPVSSTNIVSIMKQSSDKKTLADYPTVLTV